MPDYLGICVENEGFRVSQYSGWNFNSMCKFGEVYLGANENGIFVIDSGNLDNTSDIDAYFQTATTDFGLAFQKRWRSVYVGYETNGQMLLKLYDDDGNERVYQFSPIFSDNEQHGNRISIGRDGRGRYWSFRIENSLGADFSVNNITGIPVITTRKPAGA